MCHTEDTCVCCEQILYQFVPIWRVCSQPILNVLCLCSLSALIQSWRFLSTCCISLLRANLKYTCLQTTGVDCKQILNILVNSVWMCANPKHIASPLCVCVPRVFSENTELSCNHSVTEVHYSLCRVMVRNPNVHYSRPVKNTDL